MQVSAQAITAKPETVQSDTALSVLTPFKVIEQTNGVLLSADRRGYFYVADIQGNVQQYKPTSEKGLLYSPPRQTMPTVLDAWNGLNILLYSRGFQEYALLDRFLTTERLNTVPGAESGFASMLTLSNDNNLWVLDMSTFSVNKFQLNTGRLLFSNPLDLRLRKQLKDPIGCTEYQNYLYLTDSSKAVYLFDNTGVYLQTLGNSDVPVAFVNDYLLRLKGNTLTLEPLPRSPQKKPKSMGLNLEEEAISLAFSNGKLCVLTKTKLYFFDLNLN